MIDSMPEKILTIIAPLYNEADVIASFHEDLRSVLLEISEQYGAICNIIYIDDGSEDESRLSLNKASHQGLNSVRYLSLSRNFGKEAAMMAGLDYAAKGAIVFIDTDGQHPPALIKEMVEAWLVEGQDVIYTYQAQRQDGMIKSAIVRLVYKIINANSKVRVEESASDFRLLSPRAANALRCLPERSRFFKGLSVFIGFKQKKIAYMPEMRKGGVTKWSFMNLLSFAISAIVSFSLFPLRLMTAIGFILSIGSIAYGIKIIIEVYTSSEHIPGYPSLIVSNVFIGGVLTFMLGMVAEYVGQILNEVKHRPVYIIAEDEELILPDSSQKVTTDKGNRI